MSAIFVQDVRVAVSPHDTERALQLLSRGGVKRNTFQRVMVFLGNRYELKFRSGTPSVGDSFPPNNLAMAFGLVTGLICYIEFIKLTNRQFEETKLPVH